MEILVILVGDNEGLDQLELEFNFRVNLIWVGWISGLILI